MKVAVLGATGETGSSIVDALLKSTDPVFEVTALLRPSTAAGEAAKALVQRGVRVVPTDLDATPDDLLPSVQGQDVVIAAIRAFDLHKQIPLIDAAKKAGAKRFVPCDFGTVAPPKGFMRIREAKEDIHDHIKKAYIPYTFIEVGWWYQLGFPSLPSGKVDYARTVPNSWIPGDGTVKSALTDVRDVGEWVKRIISDPRTLNKQVFAYNVVLSKLEIYDIMERLSGEKIERAFLSEEELIKGIEKANAGSGEQAEVESIMYNYYLSWGVRGHNTPEYAAYLGYLNAQELYPDFKPRSFEGFIEEVLSGQAERVYTTKGLATAAAIRSGDKGISESQK